MLALRKLNIPMSIPLSHRKILTAIPLLVCVPLPATALQTGALDEQVLREVAVGRAVTLLREDWRVLGVVSLDRALGTPSKAGEVTRVIPEQDHAALRARFGLSTGDFERDVSCPPPPGKRSECDIIGGSALIRMGAAELTSETTAAITISLKWEEDPPVAGMRVFRRDFRATFELKEGGWSLVQFKVVLVT